MDENQIREEFKSVREEVRQEFVVVRREIAEALDRAAIAAKQDRHDVRDWLQEHIAGEITVVKTNQEHDRAILHKHDEFLYHENNGMGAAGRLIIIEQWAAATMKRAEAAVVNWWQATAIVVAALSGLSLMLMWAIDKIWK